MILKLLLIALLMLPLSAFSELTKEYIAAIRYIVKEEVTASEKRVREYVDLKFRELYTILAILSNKVSQKC